MLLPYPTCLGSLTHSSVPYIKATAKMLPFHLSVVCVFVPALITAARATLNPFILDFSTYPQCNYPTRLHCRCSDHIIPLSQLILNSVSPSDFTYFMVVSFAEPNHQITDCKSLSYFAHLYEVPSFMLHPAAFQSLFKVFSNFVHKLLQSYPKIHTVAQ